MLSMDIFKVGDWVYASDWCYGQIVNIDKYGYWVELDTGTGGGTCIFDHDDLVPDERK